MLKKMRRKDKEIKNKEAMELLKKCDHGVLSTVDSNGYPYGVPISYVYKNDSIYFHCAIEGKKLENILCNDKVSFCVVGDTKLIPEKFTFKYESVIVFGIASEVNDNEKNEVLLELIKKYAEDYVEKGKEYIINSCAKTRVIKIDIEHISGKGNM
ncbi:pyridoxamine 5'-phosphate oxidase family protein [Clostridium ihumii]|uniref:pyridoxamine 5'-phosphate oxidase family protein n=1 Tax=Clostridium ihumii TaxID=1470356 RepID=UPI000554C7DC|nr:pyridoxamine 5'-phosphate oxidase family protein [Clostridium ihumii]